MKFTAYADVEWFSVRDIKCLAKLSCYYDVTQLNHGSLLLRSPGVSDKVEPSNLLRIARASRFQQPSVT